MLGQCLLVAGDGKKEAVLGCCTYKCNTCVMELEQECEHMGVCVQ